VAIIVLVVPEMLSGPKPGAPPPAAPDAVRSYTVDLADSARTSPAPAAAAPPAGAAPGNAIAAGGASPAPSPSTASPVGGARSPIKPLPKSAGAPVAPVESAAASPISAKPLQAGGEWVVQLGSFASRENAEKLVRQLKAQGYAVYLSTSGSGAQLRHRVRTGPMADRDAAVRAVEKLKAQGHAATLVPPAT
jgi:DedD protein